MAARGSTSTSRASSGPQRSTIQWNSNYQTPASALYGSYEASGSSGRSSSYGEASGPPAADPIAMMEFYMKKAAQGERMKQPKQSKDEMPPPASLQGAILNSAIAYMIVIPENVEVECEGLGSDKRGRAVPVMAGQVKKDNLGVGAQKPGENLGGLTAAGAADAGLGSWRGKDPPCLALMAQIPRLWYMFDLENFPMPRTRLGFRLAVLSFFGGDMARAKRGREMRRTVEPSNGRRGRLAKDTEGIIYRRRLETLVE
ncbi:hypothetical protein B296_00012925 [Ensete ventricosum]|uniref:Uncharacterized protein n=1 Tax=Ensete ventricosum TaxID=4639 RepID=A0A427B8Q1_ENSVE|nr:hypothetical protein B296_00012925 [Ensete ventricosum]